MSDEAWRLPVETQGRLERIEGRLTAIEARLALADQPLPPVYSTTGTQVVGGHYRCRCGATVPYSQGVHSCWAHWAHS